MYSHLFKYLKSIKPAAHILCILNLPATCCNAVKSFICNQRKPLLITMMILTSQDKCNNVDDKVENKY